MGSLYFHLTLLQVQDKNKISCREAHRGSRIYGLVKFVVEVGTFQTKITSQEESICFREIKKETALEPKAQPKWMRDVRMWVTETWLQFVLTGDRSKHGRALRTW